MTTKLTYTTLDAETATRIQERLESLSIAELLFRLEINWEEQQDAYIELVLEVESLQKQLKELQKKLNKFEKEPEKESEEESEKEFKKEPEEESEKESEEEEKEDGLSRYQQEILKAVDIRLSESSGIKKGLLIEALAGCGKSFTLVKIAHLLKARGLTAESVRLLVFGRKNKEDLKQKVKDVSPHWGESVQTLHSLCLGVLKSTLGNTLQIDRFKYQAIAKKYNYISSRRNVPGTLNKGEHPAIESDKVFLDLLEKLRLYCLAATEESIAFLAEKHSLGLNLNKIENVTAAASHCLNEGLQQGLKGFVDFVDMAWVLYKAPNQFRGGIEKLRRDLRFVAVDEAQDTDQLQIGVLKLLIDPQNCLFCAVGDRYQAVYRFRGCLSDGLGRIGKEFDCETFPLPINYRCGKRHLSFVRELFPSIKIQAHSSAPEGEIRCIRASNFTQIFENPDGDYFGVCRRNAPLVKAAISLLVKNLPARVKDKSIGGRLVATVKKISPKYKKGSFLDELKSYEMQMRGKFDSFPDKEQKISALQDSLEAIVALFEAYLPSSLDDWNKIVNRIFEDSPRKAIDLYTVHSGKGGEGGDTFLLSPHSLPLRYKGQSEEELQQEYNLLYVALTRPKNTLWLVVDELEGVPIWPEWLPDSMRQFWKKG